MHDMGEGCNNNSELYSRVQKLEYKIKELELKLKISNKDMDLYKLIIDLKLDNISLNKTVQNLIANINEIESKQERKEHIMTEQDKNIYTLKAERYN